MKYIALVILLTITGCTGCSTIAKFKAVVAGSPAQTTAINAWCLAVGAAKPFVATAITHGAIKPPEFPVVNGAKDIVNGVCEAKVRPTSLPDAAYTTFKASAALLVGYQPGAVAPAQ
jgi:hypothetical protein